MDANVRAGKLLNIATTTWFVMTIVGQWIWVYVVAGFYGGTALQGDYEKWDKILPHGIIEGDTMGNIALVAHLFLAVVITVGGPLQIIPRIRNRALTFHRWNGRLYIMIAFVLGWSGLHLVWAPERGNIGDTSQHIGQSLNAILIMVFAVFTVRYALIKKIKVHCRWALRLFLVVSGVWFYRIGFMFWIFINGGPVGFDMDTFTGPFLTIWSYADYLLPLAILEIYFYVKEKAGHKGKYAMTVGLFAITLAMGVGIFLAAMGMWLPRLNL